MVDYVTSEDKKTLWKSP